MVSNVLCSPVRLRQSHVTRWFRVIATICLLSACQLVVKVSAEAAQETVVSSNATVHRNNLPTTIVITLCMTNVITVTQRHARELYAIAV